MCKIQKSLIRMKVMKKTSIPNLSFMVAGFSKCGSTTLCAMLNRHPDIYIPEIKETNFFTYEDYPKRWQEYQLHFRSINSETTVGEGTTLYSSHEHEQDARRRILAEYPDIKFIFIARDPFKRIESSYREFHHSGINFAINAPYDLSRAMEELPALIEDSKYWDRISNYLAFVPDKRILVVFLEDLIEDHHAILRRCFSFLGVPEFYAESISLDRLNNGGRKLYDSRLLRWMRLQPSIGFKIARLSPEQQNFYFSKIGLRKRFKTPLFWDASTIEHVINEVKSDSEKFLRYFGKPDNFWKFIPSASSLC